MNRLIKAEWYRVRNSYHMLRWTIVFCFFITFIAYVDILTDGEKLKGIGAFNSFMEMLVVVFCYIPMFIGGMYVTSYENKTLNYEVMTGNRPAKIIISKLLTCVPLITVILTLMSASFYITFGMQNGYGENTQISVKLLVVAFIAFRIITCAVLIMTTFKSTIGLFVIFARFMILEGIGAILLEMFASAGDSSAEAVTKWNSIFIQGASEKLMYDKLPAQSVRIMVVFGVIETIFWFVLSYNSYRKKWFN